MVKRIRMEGTTSESQGLSRPARGLCRAALVIFMFAAVPAAAQVYTDEQIVEAIYKAEGGAGADYLYGIRSVRYEDAAEARRICFNTVRNNRRRYKEYGRKNYATFLEFLASRYAPVGAENDPRGLNRNWLKNVKFFLKSAPAPAPGSISHEPVLSGRHTNSWTRGVVTPFNTRQIIVLSACGAGRGGRVPRRWSAKPVHAGSNHARACIYS